MLSLRILIGKVILLTLALFIGATVGREGPSVHVAACALYLANRVATFAPSTVERGLIRAGGAAGIGAAFNAPVRRADVRDRGDRPVVREGEREPDDSAR
jgi:H+/Cl- antiporter ClcA